MQTYDMDLVDEIRKRLKASYEEALEALEEGQGELLHSLAALEAKRKANSEGLDIIERIFDIAEMGISGVRLRLGRKVLKEMSVTQGVCWSIATAILAAFVNELTLEVIRCEKTSEPESAE